MVGVGIGLRNRWKLIMIVEELRLWQWRLCSWIKYKIVGCGGGRWCDVSGNKIAVV